MSLGHFEYYGEKEYQPRGLATCLRCGHLVRVVDIDVENLQLVDPERRAAKRWAELLGMGPPRALSIADRRQGHRAHCHGLELRATPANRTERTVEVDIDDGLGGAWRTCRVVEDLGEHDRWSPPRHFLRVEPAGGPELHPGPGDLMAYRIAGEDRWILWPYRVRSRTVAADGVLGTGKAAVVEQPARKELRAPAPVKPAPTKQPKRLRVAGVPYRGLEYLGHQPLYRGWAWRVKPWGEPDDGRNEMVAIKRPGESKWRIATFEDRIGKGADRA